MVLHKITDRIYYLEHDVSTDRPVLGYIKGDKYCLAIDAGNSQKHIEKFYSSIEQMGFQKPDYTAVTHWHWDHSFGMHVVSGKTIVCSKTNEKLKEVSQWSWSDKAMSQRLETGTDIEFCDKHIRLEYPDRNEIKVVTGDIIFNNQLVLDLGGVHCILMQVFSPHSDDCVIVNVLEEKTIFLGDAEGRDLYNNKGQYNKEKLKTYLAFINGMEFTNYVVGHKNIKNRETALKYLQDELNKLP